MHAEGLASRSHQRLRQVLRRAGRSYAEDGTDPWSVALSAPTGAGKTVIASAVVETLFDGAGSFPEDPLATVLWVTDNPALNEQTKRNMLQASSTRTPARLITIDACTCSISRSWRGRTRWQRRAASGIVTLADNRQHQRDPRPLRAG